MKKYPTFSLTFLTLISLAADSSHAADLLAYYNYNGDANDSSGNGANGTLTDGAVISADGMGYSGAGGDSSLDLGTSAAGNSEHSASTVDFSSAITKNSMSVSFWQYNVGDGAGGNVNNTPFAVVGTGAEARGFGAHTTWSNGILYFDHSGCCAEPQRLTSVGALDPNLIDGWHHVVLQVDNGSKEIWLDGVLLNSQATGAAAISSTLTGDLFVGLQYNGSVGFAGRIDEFAAYSGSLTEAEIGQLAAGTAAPTDIATLPEDADEDGLLDSWEVAFGLSPDDDGSVDPNNGPDGDPDMDGLTNLEELNAGLEPDNDDFDMDGLLDGVETNTGTYVDATDTGTDPKNADTDRDGLADGVEDGGGIFVSASQPGTDPNNSDTDGDKQSDGFKITNSTDPNDPNSKSVVATVTLIDGLLGGDLTDPEDDGVDGETIFADGDNPQTAGENFNWISITANAEEYFGNFGGSEGSFDVFDNQIGGGQNKLCCGGEPVEITVQFEVAVSLTHITLTSSNDTPGRDPLDFEIQGSNDGTVFETIYARADDESIWGGARDLTAQIDLPSPSDAYEYIRYAVTRTGIGVHAISEIEYFGETGPVAPLQITSIDFNPATNEVTLTWNSRDNRTYSVFTSGDMTGFSEDIDDSIASGGEVTSFTFALSNPIDVRRFFRVVENE